jgi:hypothetical protein
MKARQARMAHAQFVPNGRCFATQAPIHRAPTHIRRVAHGRSTSTGSGGVGDQGLNGFLKPSNSGH